MKDWWVTKINLKTGRDSDITTGEHGCGLVCSAFTYSSSARILSAVWFCASWVVCPQLVCFFAHHISYGTWYLVPGIYRYVDVLHVYIVHEVCTIRKADNNTPGTFFFFSFFFRNSSAQWVKKNATRSVVPQAPPPQKQKFAARIACWCFYLGLFIS